MPVHTPTPELNTEFSAPDAQPPSWSRIDEVLTAAEMFWISTVRSDGRPHVTPLPAIWLDGTLYFCTGTEEQKTANLRHDARCVLTTGTNQMQSGIDVVVEGTASRATDTSLLERLAALWKSKLDWDFAVGDGEFRDPEGRHGLVFGVTPEKALAFGKGDPYSQTRYRFG